ncbi:hypothetical protein [Paraconexibacter algicola]|uniref:Ig-like domain-containing protein n=1 Tax=Paraconexibacter algicola TaxID=2133960 RepID=A0A2T4UIS6_9ACTN|nr:hypothetical protein [Paraconexibacter algicola]PTL59143.1 hypothetical protein C7Y72_05505 [Paraconexibacter algicola]
MRRPLAVLALLLPVLVGAAAPGTAGAAVPMAPVADLVSATTDGTPAGAREVALAGSRYAVFTSDAADVVAGQAGYDTNGTCDVFRRDLLTGETVVVSRVPGGSTGGGCSDKPRISHRGTVVAFATDAANLITAAGGGAAPPAGVEQVLVADLSGPTPTLTVASRADGDSGALDGSPTADFDLSGDGQHVAFTADGQVWQRNLDVSPRTTVLVSAQDGTAATPIAATAVTPSIDEYGLRVAFAADLRVYVRQPGNVTTLASVTTLGTQLDGLRPDLSAAGNAVAFATRALSPSFRLQVAVRDLVAGTTTLVSHPAGAPDTTANEDAGPPTISGRGRVVAFASTATNLAAGDPRGRAQVYVADLRRDLLTLASRSGATGGDADSSTGGEGALVAPALAQDGITVAFTSLATDLVAADTTAARDAVVRRVRTPVAPPADTLREQSVGGLDGRNVGEQFRSSVGATTTAGMGVGGTALSADGRYVAFVAHGNDSYSGDARIPGNENAAAVYVRDRLTGEVEAVSRSSDVAGRPGALVPFVSGGSELSIDATGRHVTFPCDGGRLCRRDRVSGTTARVDPGANGDAFLAGMSATGRYVVFGSYATNLPGAGTSNGLPRLYRRDMSSGSIVRVDLRDGRTDDTGFVPQGPAVDQPTVSEDGRYVTWTSADVLVAGTGFDPGYRQAYLRDLQTDRTYALNRSASGDYGRFGGGATGQTESGGARITPDGRYVAFDSNAGNLVAGKTSTSFGVYRQRLTFGGPAGAIDGALDLVSVPRPGGGAQVDNNAWQPAISDDGERVAYVGASPTNVVSGVTGFQVYARDLPGGTTVLVSRADGAGGAPASGGQIAFPPTVSLDGRVVLFSTSSATLDGDAGLQYKAFARVLPPTSGPPVPAPQNTTLPSVSPAEPVTGQTATCDPGTWTGSPTFAYEWLVDDAAAAGTGPTFVPPPTAAGKQLRCRVTGANAGGSATATSGPRPVVAPPPTAEVTGYARFDETVTCDAGRFDADPSLTVTWLVGPGITDPGTPIAGATGRTFTLDDPALVERWIRCRASIVENGTPRTVTSGARYVHLDVTVVRPTAPLTPPREGERFTCSDTEVRVRPAGYGVTHSYSIRALRDNGEIAADYPASPTPTSLGPLADGTAGGRVVCLDEGRAGAATRFSSDGPLATILARSAPAPTPAPAALPGPPRATAPPTVGAYRQLDRTCRTATYDGPLTGLRTRIVWRLHLAGGQTTVVPASSLQPLVFDGQIYRDASLAFTGPTPPVGLSCEQLVTGRNGVEQGTRSAVVRPNPYCVEWQVQGGRPGRDGIPYAVTSAWCTDYRDDGNDTVVTAAPPLPRPPLTVDASGVARIVVGCGATVATTNGCAFTVSLHAIGTAFAGRAAGPPRPVTKTTRLGRRLGRATARVPRGRRAVTVRVRVDAATRRQLRRGRTVATVLVVRYRGRATAVRVGAPVLRRAR